MLGGHSFPSRTICGRLWGRGERLLLKVAKSAARSLARRRHAAFVRPALCRSSLRQAGGGG